MVAPQWVHHDHRLFRPPRCAPESAAGARRPHRQRVAAEPDSEPGPPGRRNSGDHRTAWGREKRSAAKENTIRISGKKAANYPEGSVHRRERVFGDFDRTLSLPVGLDPNGIKAEYHDA